MLSVRRYRSSVCFALLSAATSPVPLDSTAALSGEMTNWPMEFAYWSFPKMRTC
jgi:hypothetical protein